eukprot:11665007-Alexandrium_andersonii.AAC.1
MASPRFRRAIFTRRSARATGPGRPWPAIACRNVSTRTGPPSASAGPRRSRAPRLSLIHI